MGKRRDRVGGALKKAFADRNGKTLRWAQIQAQNNSSEWQAFLAENMGDVALAGSVPRSASSDLEKASLAKENAWQALQVMEGRLQKANELSDIVMAASLSKIVRELRTNWERAGIHEKRLMEDRGALVPVTVFSDIKMRCVEPLSELIGAQRDYIAGRLEPVMRVKFMEAWDEWSGEWNRKVGELHEEFERIASNV